MTKDRILRAIVPIPILVAVLLTLFTVFALWSKGGGETLRIAQASSDSHAGFAGFAVHGNGRVYLTFAAGKFGTVNPSQFKEYSIVAPLEAGFFEAEISNPPFNVVDRKVHGTELWRIVKLDVIAVLILTLVLFVCLLINESFRSAASWWCERFTGRMPFFKMRARRGFFVTWGSGNGDITD